MARTYAEHELIDELNRNMEALLGRGSRVNDVEERFIDQVRQVNRLRRDPNGRARMLFRLSEAYHTLSAMKYVQGLESLNNVFRRPAEDVGA